MNGPKWKLKLRTGLIISTLVMSDENTLATDE